MESLAQHHSDIPQEGEGVGCLLHNQAQGVSTPPKKEPQRDDASCFVWGRGSFPSSSFAQV